MNAAGDAPWELSFSYGRALQAAALLAWAGDEANGEQAQAVFDERVRCTVAARRGNHRPKVIA
jgi:fructose-bisphosphate aldolase, class I